MWSCDFSNGRGAKYMLSTACTWGNNALLRPWALQLDRSIDRPSDISNLLYYLFLISLNSRRSTFLQITVVPNCSGTMALATPWCTSKLFADSNIFLVNLSVIQNISHIAPLKDPDSETALNVLGNFWFFCIYVLYENWINWCHCYKSFILIRVPNTLTDLGVETAPIDTFTAMPNLVIGVELYIPELASIRAGLLRYRVGLLILNKSFNVNVMKTGF